MVGTRRRCSCRPATLQVLLHCGATRSWCWLRRRRSRAASDGTDRRPRRRPRPQTTCNWKRPAPAHDGDSGDGNRCGSCPGSSSCWRNPAIDDPFPLFARTAVLFGSTRQKRKKQTENEQKIKNQVNRWNIDKLGSV